MPRQPAAPSPASAGLFCGRAAPFVGNRTDAPQVRPGNDSGYGHLAFEMALVALQLADRGDLANEIIAQKIMELAKAGERDPERLCEGVLQEFRRPPQV
jgi:hypothetical protein